jgi:microcin C transport system permease protein
MIFKSSIARRRLANFRANRRAVWSLWIFAVIFVICLFAELVANDKPLLVSFKGDFFTPAFQFYPETAFGGDFETEPDYSDPVVQCLIKTGGIEECFDIPEDVVASLDAGT